MVLENPSPEKYLVCNTGKEGTFKGLLLRLAPARRILMRHAVILNLPLHKRPVQEQDLMTRALGEARDAGYVGTEERPGRSGIEVRVVESPGRYIGGEETACLEVIEGKAPIPRQKPPFYPAAIGLFGQPTVVNNVETLSNLPHILARGADWFRTIGPANNHGTRVFCLSGDVERPGLYERPMGYSLRDLLEKDGGGIRGGGTLKAVFPGGPSLLLCRRTRSTCVSFNAIREGRRNVRTRDVRRRRGHHRRHRP
jgi:NADH-quinone oxidoreductase subunit F